MSAAVKPARPKAPADPLVKKWFHSFTPCQYCEKPHVQWQGQILARLPSGSYLVQTYSWVMGELYDQQIVTPERIERESWRFYDDNETMNFRYEETLGRQHENCYGPVPQPTGKKATFTRDEVITYISIATSLVIEGVDDDIDEAAPPNWPEIRDRLHARNNLYEERMKAGPDFLLGETED
jgi:hypothetical protein